MNNEHNYHLGNRIYQLQSKDSALLALLNKLLPSKDTLSNNEHIETVIFDLDGPLTIRGLDETLYAKDDPSAALVSLLDRVLADHEGYLWIDASALLTPKEKLVLIAGPSHSGKTTLTLAMAMKHNWKVVAEDIVLIDRETGMLAPFARPLSLRPDTQKKIELATGMNVGEFVLDGWLTNKDWHSLKSKPAQFSTALDLKVTASDSTASLDMKAATRGEFVRQLMSHSNALRYDNGVATLSRALEHSQCYFLDKGTVQERMNVLLKLDC